MSATWTIWQTIVWLRWENDELTEQNLDPTTAAGTRMFPPNLREFMTGAEAEKLILTRLQQGIISFSPDGQELKASFWLVQDRIERKYLDHRVLVANFKWKEKVAKDNRRHMHREWIGWREIADKCAVPPGDLVANPSRRDGALKNLLDYFENGGFEENGKSVVVPRANKGHYDDPSLNWREFDASFGIARNDPLHVRKLCEDMEIPRAYALRWFLAHDLPLPACWFSEVEIAAAKSVPAASAELSGRSEAPAIPPRRNKTGPKPEKRDSIVARMVADYDNRPEALAGEKVLLLTHTYGASKHTVTKAREQAMAELWKNSGRTLDTGK